MPEAFFSIPKDIVRREASLGSGGNNVAEELLLVDLGRKGFVLQHARVTIMEDTPQENLIVSLVVRAPNRQRPPIPPVVIHALHVPLAQSGHLKANGSGMYMGVVQGPLPLKPSETLSFQVQRKAGPGTFTFHAQVWGFAR